MNFETRNSLAKIAVVAWIATLAYAATRIAESAVTLDPNAYFGLAGEARLPADAVLEIKVLVLMLAVSIVGGISFIIKDFYRSVKYANIYDRAYADFKSGDITREGFQKLATVEIYSGRFNYTWVFWFFVQPVLSSVLGIIAFFIARSGLGVIQGAGSGPEISIRSLYMYAVFTFLAGFSSHKFIAWLDRLADKIFSTTLPEAKADEKARIESAASVDRMALRGEVPRARESGEEDVATLPSQPPDASVESGAEAPPSPEPAETATLPTTRTKKR